MTSSLSIFFPLFCTVNNVLFLAVTAGLWAVLFTDQLHVGPSSPTPLLQNMNIQMTPPICPFDLLIISKVMSSKCLGP